MKITEKMRPAGSEVFYEEGFRSVIEDHLPYLRTLASTKRLSVAPHDATVYEHDLFTYLLSLNIEKQLHWIIMRVNGFNTPADFTSETERLLVPDTSVLELMRRRYVTSHSI